MTSRYALYETDKIRDRFACDTGLPRGVKPHYNISPVQEVPVVLQRDGQRVVERMIWGLVPVGARDTNSVFRYKTFAAKSEGILDRPALRTALRSQRCIISVNGFYEWKNLPSGKRPFYIRTKTHELFGLAGLYSEWTDPAGVTHGVCTVLTIDSEADDDMTPSRLPIIIEQADEVGWLDPSIGDLSTLFRIMRPVEASTLEIIPVSDAVNSTKPDSPDLIERFQR